MIKKCPRCYKEKDIEQFNKNKGRKDGHDSYCKICTNFRNKLRREKNPLQEKERTMKKLYGLSLENFYELYSDQNGKCIICQKGMRRPQIDHNHQTGKIRGLLCHKCNILLALANENLRIFENAIMYLYKDKIPEFQEVQHVIGSTN